MTIYYCVIGQMFHSIKHDELKKSYVFNRTMAAHYQAFFKSYCKSLRFTLAMFCFFKWQHYKNAAAKIENQLMLTPNQSYKN